MSKFLNRKAIIALWTCIMIGMFASLGSSLTLSTGSLCSHSSEARLRSRRVKSVRTSVLRSSDRRPSASRTSPAGPLGNEGRSMIHISASILLPGHSGRRNRGTKLSPYLRARRIPLPLLGGDRKPILTTFCLLWASVSMGPTTSTTVCYLAGSE